MILGIDFPQSLVIYLQLFRISLRSIEESDKTGMFRLFMPGSGSVYREEFTVRVKVDPTSIAYTGKNIEIHTDACYYDYMPGVSRHETEYLQKGGGTIRVNLISQRMNRMSSLQLQK